MSPSGSRRRGKAGPFKAEGGASRQAGAPRLPVPPRRPPARRGGSGRRLFPVLIGAVVVLGVVVVAWVSLGSKGDEAAAPNEMSKRVTVDGDALPDFSAGMTTANDPAIGQTAPSLSAKDFEGEQVTFADEGKKRVVVFVAHWCPHCQIEVPRIVSAARDGATEGIEIQTVVTGTDETAPNYPPSAWLEEEGWDFPVLADDKAHDAATAFGLSGYPFLVYVDENGKVVARHSGEIQEDVLAQGFRDFAAGKTPSFD